MNLSKFLVQWASVLTAVSFLLSALAYCLIFAIWGLDFTAVATVEDVVMGGIRLLSFAIPVAIIVTLYRLADRVLVVRHKAKRYLRWTLLAAVTVSLLLTIVFYAKGDWAELPLRQRSWLIAILLHIFLAASVVILCSYPRPRLIGEAAAVLVNEARWLTFVITAVASVLVMIGVSLGRYEGMSIAGGVALPANCTSEVAVIRWIGSRSIVMSCGDETFVLGNGDSVILAVRPFPRPDPAVRAEQQRRRAEFLRNLLSGE